MSESQKHKWIPGQLRVRVPLLLLTAVIVGALWFTRENPNQLLREAKEFALKNPAQAEQLLERCLVAHPDFPEAQLLYCRILGGLGDWKAAYGMFHLIKRPETLPAPALLEFARQAVNARQHSLAHSALGACRRADSSSSGAARLLLEVCWQQGLHDQVLELSHEMTTRFPDDPLPWHFIAMVYRNQKLPDKAVAAYQTALRLQPDSRVEQQIRVELTRTLLELGEIAAAREAISPLLNHSVPPTEANLLDAALLRYEGHSQDAIRTLERLLDQQPNLVPALLLRGLINFDSGRFEAARDDLVKVTQFEPRRGEAHYKLSQAYQRLGDLDLAEAELQLAKKLNDDITELGMLYYRISQGTADDVTQQRFRELSQQIKGR